MPNFSERWERSPRPGIVFTGATARNVYGLAKTGSSLIGWFRSTTGSAFRRVPCC